MKKTKNPTKRRPRPRPQRKYDEFVFRFWDGEKTRGVDAVAMSMDFMDQIEDIDKLLKLASADFPVTDNEEKLKEQARVRSSSLKQVVSKICGVLGVKEYEEINDVGSGLKFLEILDLANQLIDFLEVEKKNSNG